MDQKTTLLLLCGKYTHNYCFVGSRSCSTSRISKIDSGSLTNHIWSTVARTYSNSSNYRTTDFLGLQRACFCLQGPEGQCASQFLRAVRVEANCGWQMGRGHPANSHTGSGWHSNTPFRESAHYRQELSLVARLQEYNEPKVVAAVFSNLLSTRTKARRRDVVGQLWTYIFVFTLNQKYLEQKKQQRSRVCSIGKDPVACGIKFL